MRVFKNIISILIAVIFLISSTGYVMYKTNCLCMGKEQTSVFVKPETCEDNFHQHHKHDNSEEELACSEHECHECEDHTNDCGCETPQFFFFKLAEQAIDEEVKFITVEAPVITVAAIEVLLINNEKDTELADEIIYTDPPPNILSSLDFLISIQQLKIPTLA